MPLIHITGIHRISRCVRPDPRDGALLYGVKANDAIVFGGAALLLGLAALLSIDLPRGGGSGLTRPSRSLTNDGA